MANITLLFPTFNRLEFTKVALETLIKNTPPYLVHKMLVVDGSSSDGTGEYLKERLSRSLPFPHRLITIKERHVVSAMLTAYQESKTPFIAKLDSDTVVPKGWLEACADVMNRHEDLWALGIEPFSRIEDCASDKRGVKASSFVGGIGLFRREAWKGLRASKPPFFGWTEHQQKSDFKKGWLHPAMRVILLDRMPFEPFRSLSQKYVDSQWQRPWPFYPESCAPRWEWKFPDWKGTRRNEAEQLSLTVGAYYEKVPGSIGVCPHKGVATDMVCDPFTLSRRYSNVGVVYCYNMLQYIPWRKIGDFFAELFKVLAPGGNLEVGTIDVKDVCREYISKKDPEVRHAFLQHLYGEQKLDHDFHKGLYDAEMIVMFMERAGFVDIKKGVAKHPWGGPLCVSGGRPK